MSLVSTWATTEVGRSVERTCDAPTNTEVRDGAGSRERKSSRGILSKDGVSVNWYLSPRRDGTHNESKRCLSILADDVQDFKILVDFVGCKMISMLHRPAE